MIRCQEDRIDGRWNDTNIIGHTGIRTNLDNVEIIFLFYFKATLKLIEFS